MLDRRRRIEMVVAMDDCVGNRLPNGEFRKVVNIDLLPAGKIERRHILAGLNEAQHLIEGEQQRRIEPLNASGLPSLGLPILVNDRGLRASAWGAEEDLPRLQQLLSPIDYAQCAQQILVSQPRKPPTLVR